MEGGGPGLRSAPPAGSRLRALCARSALCPLCPPFGAVQSTVYASQKYRKLKRFPVVKRAMDWADLELVCGLWVCVTVEPVYRGEAAPLGLRGRESVRAGVSQSITLRGHVVPGDTSVKPTADAVRPRRGAFANPPSLRSLLTRFKCGRAAGRLPQDWHCQTHRVQTGGPRMDSVFKFLRAIPAAIRSTSFWSRDGSSRREEPKPVRVLLRRPPGQARRTLSLIKHLLAPCRLLGCCALEC
ncbi:hypothetical protein AAFF_G00206750 [Aldrovandia affinis]|uniref:Uncharacterized protein n=1 Tax=Aldrovandia affinis TaxID=143900 RepID=A0AAD7RHM3_9TELE|nr:hypothetical protein AAFF_G00206750 [Aldrovandia affinis]